MKKSKKSAIFMAVLAAALYALAPFIGVALSLVIFREIPSASFLVGLVIMIAGTYFASTDTAAE